MKNVLKALHLLVATNEIKEVGESLENKTETRHHRGVSLIIFSDFAPLLAQIPYSTFINLLQNYPSSWILFSV